MMILTRRTDLEVVEQNSNSHLDFLVRIVKDDFPSTRLFGIAVKGTTSIVTTDGANQLLDAGFQGLRAQEFSYPVCLFLFTMKDNEGTYSWLVEPVVEDDMPLLNVHSRADCRVLTASAVDTIVGQIDHWYEEFHTSITRHVEGNDMRDGLKVLHAIIDAEARYASERGEPPKLLKLPVLLAYDLAKLGREHMGELSGKILKDGVRVLEQEGLLGMKVKIVRDLQEISVE